MATIVYPYDPSGIEATNLISNELRSVQPPANINQASFIIPNAAPFFNQSLEVWTGKNKTGTKLLLGKDYFLTHEFVAGSNYLGKPLSGGICFTNALYSGNVYLTYQTLGGDFVVNDISLLENITRKLYGDVRFVNWDQLTGVPSAFPANAHQHNVTDVKTLADVVSSLNNIASALVGSLSDSAAGGSDNGSAALSLIRTHISATSNAHTPGAVGLGNVMNYPVANETEVIALRADRYMTPALSGYHIKRLIQAENLTQIRNDIIELEAHAERVDESLRVLNGAVTALSEAISEVNSQINNYRLEVAKLNDQILDSMDLSNMALTVAMQSIAQSAATETNLANALENVNNTLYLNTVILPVGTHSLNVPPGTAMRVELIGGGGGSGRWYQTSTEQSLYAGGLSSGQDSVLWFLGTLTKAIEPVPLLVAGGGLSGTNSYGNIGRSNSGEGGVCYRFRNERVLVSSIKDIQLGLDLVKGTSETEGQPGHLGDTANTQAFVPGVGGWTLDASGDGYTQTYGRAGRAVTRAGMGGSGGRWFIVVQNDTTEIARFSITIGGRGLNSRTTANDEVKLVTDKIISSGVGVLTIVA